MTQDVLRNGPIRILLLGAPLNTGNMGVSALASGTVASVLNSFPNAEISLLDYGKEPARCYIQCRSGSVEVKLVNLRFCKKISLKNNVARLLCIALIARFLPQKWKRALLIRNPYLKSIIQADIVAAIAGGDSFSDIYGIRVLCYVALPQILALCLGQPLVLLPQTIGPFKSALAVLIGRYILRRASVVYSRDKAGVEQARRLLGSQSHKLRFSYDMAFILEPIRPDAEKLAGLPRRGNGASLIGINVSGLLLMGGYSGDNMFGLKGDYRQLVRDVIDRLIREHRANVLLVPHVFGNHAESDDRACAQIFQELQGRYPERLHLLRGSFNQHEIKYIIGQCDFFLGSRMHACIAALSQTVPAVCLAYSRKFVGVMESIGCADLVADLCSLDNDEVLACIARIFALRFHFRELLQERMPKIQAEVLGFFSAENVCALNGRSLGFGSQGAVVPASRTHATTIPDVVKSEKAKLVS